MDKRKFFHELSVIAHWKFSRKEAEDIIVDYETLAEDANTLGDDFFSQIGSPMQAIAEVQAGIIYKIWLLAFCWMIFCILGLIVELFSYTHNQYLDVFFASTGFLISTGWFLRTEKGYVYKTSLSKKFFVPLLIMLAALFLEWWLFKTGNHSSSLQYAYFFRLALLCIGSLSALVGILGIIMAKLLDRRWRAIYAFSLTILENSVFIFSICHDTALNHTIQGWYTPYIWKGGSIVALGVVATIISLY